MSAEFVSADLDVQGMREQSDAQLREAIAYYREAEFDGGGDADFCRKVRLAYEQALRERSELAAPGPELVSAGFDGSKLGSVTLNDGTQFDVIVDVNDRAVSFDVFGARDWEAAKWVAAHHEQLEDAWAAREADHV